MIITWNTHKTEAGFQFTVFSMGHEVSTRILKTGVCSSRAKAALLAKKWVRYLKSEKVAA